MTYILVLMACMPLKPITALSSVPGFKTLQDCDAAGKLAAAKVYPEGTIPQLEYVCLKQP